MSDIEIEAIGLMKQADNYRQVHSNVYAYNIYGQSHISRFRNGERNLSDKKGLEIIKAYKNELKVVKDRINNIEVNF